MEVRGHARTQESMTSVAFVVSCWLLEIITDLSLLAFYSRNLFMAEKKILPGSYTDIKMERCAFSTCIQNIRLAVPSAIR